METFALARTHGSSLVAAHRASSSQPGRLTVELTRAGPTLHIAPNASCFDDPRQPDGVMKPAENKYYHRFRRAAGVLAPCDVLALWVDLRLREELTARFGAEVAEASCRRLLSDAGRYWRSHRDGTIRTICVTKDGRPTRISGDTAKFICAAVEQAEREIHRMLRELVGKGQFEPRGCRGEVIATKDLDPWTLGARYANSRYERYVVPLVGANRELAASPPIDRVDARSLAALGIEMPSVHVEPDGAVKLLDHHRIRGAMAFGLPIQTQLVQSISTFN